MLAPQDTDIDATLLARTNKLWNELRLNHPWSVGFTSELIRNYHFEDYAAWRHHYLESGVIRDMRMTELETEEIDQLNNHQWYHTADEEDKEALTTTLINLNFHRGRSPSSIYNKAIFFQSELKKQHLNLELSVVAALIGHRILVETWNGHVRETNTIDKLEASFPHLIFVASDGWSDFKYAVDFIVHDDDGLVGALQIKPESYNSNADYVQAAQKANLLKNQQYTKETEKPVWTILSTLTGAIVDDGEFFAAIEQTL